MPHPTADPPAAQKSAYHHGDLRRALLDAAEIELTESGVERFSLRGVAKRAGVSHGAPAHHFGDAGGLLTALAARGYARFIAAQDAREKAAADDPRAKLAASGLGYLDFAAANPALFRLMFASDRPDKSDPVLSAAADAAFEKLVRHIEAVSGRTPHTDKSAMSDVLAAWGVAHGLADLMIAGRLGRATFLDAMGDDARDRLFAEIILRAVPERSDGAP
ncbi:MAG: TetR/AcrR family transcriptional regulator [Pseudomonadota bacterium]